MRAQDLAAHRRDVVDGPFLVAELGGLIKGQVVDRDGLRGGLEWYPVPPQHAGDLQITLVFEDGDEDQVGRA